MTEIRDNTIIITRGDSSEFTVTPLNGDGTPYILSEDEEVHFIVRGSRDKAAVIKKELTARDQSEDGSLRVCLCSEDTSVQCLSYLYEVKLYNTRTREQQTFIGGGSDKTKLEVV